MGGKQLTDVLERTVEMSQLLQNLELAVNAREMEL
jgi:hypothetical protein